MDGTLRPVARRMIDAGSLPDDPSGPSPHQLAWNRAHEPPSGGVVDVERQIVRVHGYILRNASTARRNVANA